MKENLIEVGPGYRALVYYEGWRVAFLNDDPSKYRRETIPYLERHNETDELFVLLEGECTLYVADGVGDALGQISTVVMEKRKMYNIKKGVWHNLAGNEQMVLLIVENADTSKGNSVLREFLSCFPLILRAFPAFCLSVIRCADHKKRHFFIQQ